MRFVDNVDEREFQLFNEEQPVGHALQSPEWGKFKSRGEWKYQLVGVRQDNQLIAAAMVLRRRLPLGMSIFYVPRGFVMDYRQSQVLAFMTNQLVGYCKKQKGILLTIDPCIVLQERTLEGQIVADGISHHALVKELKELGYRHKGDSVDFEGIQPRFVFQLPLDRPLVDIQKNFHHKTRYNIRVADRKGVRVYEGKEDDLVEFHRIMEVTGKRDGFITRPLSYFRDMYQELAPTGRMKLYMAKYDISKALETTEQAIDKEQGKANSDDKRILKLQTEKEELVKLKEQYPEGLLVSGTILLINGKKAWYLYGASDNLYRNVMANYKIQWAMIQEAYQAGCQVYDFRGISGDLNPDNPLYGLYRFKKGFNGQMVEYIGEFDYPIRPFFYYLWEWLLPKVKKWMQLTRSRRVNDKKS